jgi:hypothetical protein
MLPEITDEYMQQMRATTKNYTLMILKQGPEFVLPGAEKIIWEHGRRNFSLRAAGLLSIVCPVNDGTGVFGIGIFNTDMHEAKKIMDEDPGVEKRIFVYELHPCRSFPGDRLP